jgi:hypothetical protein
MSNFTRNSLAVAWALLSAAPAAAESFRCGQWIASPDMSIEELLEKCGEPTNRTVEEIEVYGPGVSGGGRVKRGTSIIEKWTYDRGSQASAMVVTIEDGKIKSMARAP